VVAMTRFLHPELRLERRYRRRDELGLPDREAQAERVELADRYRVRQVRAVRVHEQRRAARDELVGLLEEQAPAATDAVDGGIRVVEIEPVRLAVAAAVQLHVRALTLAEEVRVRDAGVQ